MCHERYRQVLDNSPLSVVLTDVKGSIKFVNKAFERITGYSFDEALGQNPRILKSGTMPDSFYRELWETIVSGAVWHGDIENKRKDGSFYYERFCIVPIKDRAGEIKEFLAIKQDLSPQKAVEEKVRELQEENTRRLQYEKQKNDEIRKLYHELETHARELERLDEQRSAFVSFVSHELRTPLTVVREGVSIIKDRILGEVNEQQDELLGDTLESIDRLRRIIDDLLDLSKLDADKIVLERGEVPAVDFVEKATAQFASVAQRRGIMLRWDTTAMSDEVMYADKDRLMQVITNLVGNALKFTPEGGTVTVAAETKGDAVLVTVSDSGRGISTEDQAKLFDRYQQFGKAERPADKGTGLGLSIAKRLVELHGGFIGVQSQEGVGSVFWFTVPTVQHDSQTGSLHARTEYAIRTQKRFSIISFASRKPGADVHPFALDAHREANKNQATAILENEKIYVLLPMSDREAAVAAAISMRAMLAQKHATDKDLLRHSVVVYPEDGETSEMLFACMDREEGRKRTVLLADDEKNVISALKRAVHAQRLDQDIDIMAAGDGLEAYELACAKTPDVIIVDLLMPRMNGYEVIGRLKENAKTAHIPLLILTGDPEMSALSASGGASGGARVFAKADGLDAVVEYIKEIV
jgi:PAS domain S-box-containing protein